MSKKKNKFTIRFKIFAVILVIAIISIIIFSSTKLLDKNSTLTCNVNIETEGGTRIEEIVLNFEDDKLIEYSSTLKTTHTDEFNELAPSYYTSFVEMLNGYEGVEAKIDIKDAQYTVTTQINVNKSDKEIFYIIESPLEEKNVTKEQTKEIFEANNYECK